jgi:hypothetical protein
MIYKVALTSFVRLQAERNKFRQDKDVIKEYAEAFTLARQKISR